MSNTASALAQFTVCGVGERAVDQVKTQPTAKCGHGSVRQVTSLAHRLSASQLLPGFNLRNGGHSTALRTTHQIGRLKAATTYASLTVEQPAKMFQEYTLEGSSRLQIEQSVDGNAYVTLTIVGGDLAKYPLVLHWGATMGGNSKWTLPNVQPNNTRNYKNRALQSPFEKKGDTAVLRVEIADKGIDAIEFNIKNEETNQWFKLDNGNFRVEISNYPSSKSSQVNVEVSAISIPEDMVQVQAYLRWERNGKQNYSQEQEKASNSAMGKCDCRTNLCLCACLETSI